MVKQKRNKDTICATVSPYTKKQVEALVDSGEFGSMSDLVGVAITEFLAKYHAEKEKQSTTESNNKNPTEDIVLRRKVVFD
jgi:Arc/MetJ-type ribon-helix-helix transcriptional regulator